MKKEKNRIFAALLIATAAGPLSAQEVWRCGNEYRQQPCQHGTALKADDPRTADEASRAEAAVRRQTKAADELEKARLAQEAKAPPANILPQSAEPAHPHRDGKEYKPVHFTAIAPKPAPSESAKAQKKKRRSKQSD